jgi:hypothetical protein
VKEKAVARAFVDIGVSFSEWAAFDDAVACWHSSMLMSCMTLADRITVLFNIGAAHAEMRDYKESVA